LSDGSRQQFLSSSDFFCFTISLFVDTLHEKLEAVTCAKLFIGSLGEIETVYELFKIAQHSSRLRSRRTSAATGSTERKIR
jgi:hypothetical protein